MASYTEEDRNAVLKIAKNTGWALAETLTHVTPMTMQRWNKSRKVVGKLGHKEYSQAEWDEILAYAKANILDSAASGIRAAAKKYDLSMEHIYKVNILRGNPLGSDIRRSKNSDKYTKEFKEAAMKLLQRGATLEEAAKSTGASISAIRRWNAKLQARPKQGMGRIPNSKRPRER